MEPKAYKATIGLEIHPSTKVGLSTGQALPHIYA